MDAMSPQALELLADRFALLAHPGRLSILQQICHAERSVSELVELTGLRQTTVSKHLGLLDRGGLLRRRTDGNRVYYVLADPALPRLCEVMQESLQTRQKQLLRALSK